MNVVENDLSDLRAARKITENIVAQIAKEYNEEITMIINHLQLKVDNLIKFRSVLEIMGY